MGTNVLVLRDIRRWAGLVCISVVGVLRWSSKLSHGSLLSLWAFLNKFFTTFTADSAFPFDFGWYGEEVTC